MSAAIEYCLDRVAQVPWLWVGDKRQADGVVWCVKMCFFFYAFIFTAFTLYIRSTEARRRCEMDGEKSKE